MAPLSPASIAALARLRAYKPPPFAVWDRLPLTRRAAVLILLFADRRGDLRVVITMRAASLRNYSGHAAFPGGKADTLSETPFEIARREACEEIGLPREDSKFPSPFRIEHLCQLPFSLAKTALVVRPCVAYLHSGQESDGGATEGLGDMQGSVTSKESPGRSGRKIGKVEESGNRHTSSSVEETLIPRLDAKEVAAVFSAPFHNFLRTEDEIHDEHQNQSVITGNPSDWYDGQWIDWYEGKWRMHSFYVPIQNQRVTKPKPSDDGFRLEVGEDLQRKEEEEGLQRYKVWGMTARMLVDAARVAYSEEPEFEYNEHIGDELMITNLEKMGRLGEKVPGGPDLTDGDIRAARLQAVKGSSDAKI